MLRHLRDNCFVQPGLLSRLQPNTFLFVLPLSRLRLLSPSFPLLAFPLVLAFTLRISRFVRFHFSHCVRSVQVYFSSFSHWHNKSSATSRQRAVSIYFWLRPLSHHVYLSCSHISSDFGSTLRSHRLFSLITLVQLFSAACTFLSLSYLFLFLTHSLPLFVSISLSFFQTT